MWPKSNTFEDITIDTGKGTSGTGGCCDIIRQLLPQG